MRKSVESELGWARRQVAKKHARPPYKPVPLESGLAREDVSEEDLADERLGNALVEKSDKLDRILKNTEQIVKLTRRIYVRLEKTNLYPEGYNLKKRGDRE